MNEEMTMSTMSVAMTPEQLAYAINFAARAVSAQVQGSPVLAPAQYAALKRELGDIVERLRSLQGDALTAMLTTPVWH